MSDLKIIYDHRSLIYEWPGVETGFNFSQGTAMHSKSHWSSTRKGSGALFIKYQRIFKCNFLFLDIFLPTIFHGPFQVWWTSQADVLRKLQNRVSSWTLQISMFMSICMLLKSVVTNFDFKNLFFFSSSTWASHLLKMAKVPIRPRMPLHLVARWKYSSVAHWQ